MRHEEGINLSFEAFRNERSLDRWLTCTYASLGLACLKLSRSHVSKCCGKQKSFIIGHKLLYSHSFGYQNVLLFQLESTPMQWSPNPFLSIIIQAPFPPATSLLHLISGCPNFTPAHAFNPPRSQWDARLQAFLVSQDQGRISNARNTEMDKAKGYVRRPSILDKCYGMGGQ